MRLKLAQLARTPRDTMAPGRHGRLCWGPARLQASALLPWLAVSTAD